MPTKDNVNAVYYYTPYTATTTAVNDTNLISDFYKVVGDFAADSDCTSIGTYAFAYIDPHPEWNCKPKNFMYKWISSIQEPSIVNISIIVPSKVVEVTIYDGGEHVYKQVCREPDEFSLEFALALAWAKYDNEQGRTGFYRLTGTGLEDYANKLLSYYQETRKEFDRAIKAYNKWCKEQAKEKAEEEERKAIISRRQAKNKKRKEKAKAKKKAEEVATIVEAIKLSKKEGN